MANPFHRELIGDFLSVGVTPSSKSWLLIEAKRRKRAGLKSGTTLSRLVRLVLAHYAAMPQRERDRL